MKKQRFEEFVLLLAAFCIISEGIAKENVKLAQTGMQFLSVVSDARAAALGNAVTTMPLGSASLFFNPAMITESGFIECSASHNRWIADITHNAFSTVFNPEQGLYGAFGISFQNVDYGEILGTIVSDNYKGYEDIGNLNVSGLAVGIGYGRRLTDQFAVGGHIRWVHQDLGESFIPATDTTTRSVENKLNPIVFDFGTIFKTGFKSLVFGMSIRNFSKEVKYASESFELPLTFAMGVSIDAMDAIEDRSVVKSVLVSLEAVHHRDYPEQILSGIECNLLSTVFIRAGYALNGDEYGASYGIGVSQFGLSVDYAYTPFGIFDKVQRLTLRYGM